MILCSILLVIEELHKYTWYWVYVVSIRCVSYGQKRDRWILLSSNMSWEYITVILAFCNHCIFLHVFIYSYSFSSCSVKHWGMNKPEIFGWGNLHHKNLKCLRNNNNNLETRKINHKNRKGRNFPVFIQ